MSMFDGKFVFYLVCVLESYFYIYEQPFILKLFVFTVILLLFIFNQINIYIYSIQNLVEILKIVLE